MATKLKLGEVLVDAAVLKLQAGLAARLQTINADYDDGITVEAPDPASYYTSGIQSIPKAPAIIVAEGPMELDPQLEGPHSFITSTHLLVYVLDQHPDRQQLGKKLQRLARGVIETIWDDPPQEQLQAGPPFDGRPAAFRIHVDATTPGRVFDPDQGDQLRGFYLIAFRALQLEE